METQTPPSEPNYRNADESGTAAANSERIQDPVQNSDATTGIAPTGPAFVSGLLAAAAALGVGELLAGISSRVPSLIRGVGDVFVDYTPGEIVRTSIENLGSSQKPALLWGIGVTAILLGGLLGLWSRKSNRAGIVGFAIFGVVGAWAATRVPLFSSGWGVFSAILATAVGLTVFVSLMALARRVPEPSVADTASDTLLRRRKFMNIAGVAGLWGVFSLGLGRFLKGRQNVEAEREALATRLAEAPQPTPAVSLQDVMTFADVDGISPLITPNDQFYRIDTALQVPQINPNDWHMTIKGMVDNEIRFTLDDLLEMEQMASDITLSCVSNDVGGTLVGNARWTGVRLSDLLDRAGVQPGATQIVGRSWDDWDCGFPTEVAFDGRDCMVAITMNGEPLPVLHGFPARLVIPGLYGYVSATKWLKEIELTTLEDFDGYWIPRGWAKYGPIKTQSRIDVPKRNGIIAAGSPQAIAGVAWAGIRAISRVEVRVDGGEWVEATLGEELANSTWRQWMVPFEFTPGDHQVQVRATDGEDMTQGEQRKAVAPDGAEGYHTINVRAE